MTEEAQTTSEPTTAMSAPEAAAPEQAPDWRSGLSEDYKGKLDKFKDIDGLAKSYLAMESKMGQNPIVKPGEDADEAAIAEFRKQIGKELGASEDVADYTSNEEYTKFAEIAAANNIPTEGFNAIIEAYEADKSASIDKLREGTQETFKKEWGSDYNANMQKATEVVRQFAPEALQDEIIGNHPTFVKFAHMVAQNFGDKIGEGSVQTATSNVNSVDSLEAKRQDLLKKSLDATLTPEERSNAVREASEVYKRMYSN